MALAREATRPLQPIAPIARQAMQVHHGQNQAAIAINDVDERVRKSANQNAAQLTPEDGAGTRELSDEPPGFLDRRDKSVTETRGFAGVVIGRRLELRLRGGMENRE